MGAWSEDIYSNDKAMDMFWKLRAEYEKLKCLNKAINVCKQSSIYNNNEAKLIVADIEYFYNGTIENIDIINTIIDEELSLIKDWDNPELRKEYLLNFKNRINVINNKHSVPIRKKIKDFFDFIDSKDIIALVLK